MQIRFRRLVAGAAVIAATASLTVGAWPSQAQHASDATPELGELIAGTNQYVDGTHVWTDYAYDDRGPNTNSLAGGDATYPTAAPGNEADLIQLQLGTDRQGQVTVAAILETLRDDSDAVVGVGLDIDPDAEPQTGAVSVEGGQWKNTDSLGLDYLVVLPTTGDAKLREWNGTAWQDSADEALVATAVDRETNVVSATLSLQPDGATWEAVGVVGVLDDAGGSWQTGAQPIYDLAYVRAEDPTDEVIVALREQVPQLGFTPLQDKNQADVLSGYGPTSSATAKVSFGTGETTEPPLGVGFNAFLYHATIDVPEGLPAGPVYNGPYMPYAVWVPVGALPADPDPDVRTPLLMFLHGANQYQNVNLVHFNNPQAMVLPSPYNVPAVVIFPNGRTTGWGTPLADRDALDAMNDALGRERLQLDADRVVVSGVSSGGAGTYAMAARYPDQFTGAYSLVGGGTTNLQNLTNVPFRASNGLLDPLVRVDTWRSSADALNAAGTVDYRIVLVHNRSHDGPLPEGNCYYLDLLSRDRVTSPARVRYGTLPFNQARADYGLDKLADGAYWVDDMVARDNTASANADLESLALDPRTIDQDNIREVKENAVTEQDFCGPHPGFRKGSNWNTEGRSFKTSARDTYSNTLTGSFVNLESISIDIEKAGLDLGKPIVLDITTDGPTTVTLEGPGGWKKVKTVG
jgi:pimeloyl-ACP methyl ester carboxylesterase